MSVCKIFAEETSVADVGTMGVNNVLRDKFRKLVSGVLKRRQVVGYEKSAYRTIKFAECYGVFRKVLEAVVGKLCIQQLSVKIIPRYFLEFSRSIRPITVTKYLQFSMTLLQLGHCTGTTVQNTRSYHFVLCQ